MSESVDESGIDIAELSLSCQNLRNKDWLSKSDPFVVLFVQPRTQRDHDAVIQLGGFQARFLPPPSSPPFPDRQPPPDDPERITCATDVWHYIGETEVVWNTLSPSFVSKFRVPWCLVSRLRARFEVYDMDIHDAPLNKQDFLGACEISFRELAAARNSVLHLRDKKGRIKSTLGSMRVSIDRYLFAPPALALPLTVRVQFAAISGVPPATQVFFVLLRAASKPTSATLCADKQTTTTTTTNSSTDDIQDVDEKDDSPRRRSPRGLSPLQRAISSVQGDGSPRRLSLRALGGGGGGEGATSKASDDSAEWVHLHRSGALSAPSSKRDWSFQDSTLREDVLLAGDEARLLRLELYLFRQNGAHLRIGATRTFTLAQLRDGSLSNRSRFVADTNSGANLRSADYSADVALAKRSGHLPSSTTDSLFLSAQRSAVSNQFVATSRASPHHGDADVVFRFSNFFWWPGSKKDSMLRSLSGRSIVR